MLCRALPRALRAKFFSATMRDVRFFAIVLGFSLLVTQVHAQTQTRPRASNYQIPTDVQAVGGGEAAKSTNYLLDDTIGEANIGDSRSGNYDLNAGYRQTTQAYIALGCPLSVSMGTIVLTGQATGSGSCTVTTDADAGYSLSWGIRSGSGGTSTGYLINPSEQTIPPIFAPRTGLIGHWRLDETTAGSTAIDSSGFGHDGTPSGASGTNNKPQPSTSIPSNANFRDLRSLSFDGTDDSVSVSTGLTNTQTKVTFSAWANGTPTFRVILSLGPGVWIGTLGDKWAWNTSPGNYMQSTASVTSGWHHIVGTADGTTNRLYVDGVQVASAAGTLGDASGAGRIGDYSGGGYNWIGQIDDVRVYNRDLTASEVKALYATPQTWSVASNDAAWGARLRSSSTDTDSRWGTDGSTEKWLHIGDGDYSVVQRNTSNHPGSSTEIFQFRSEVGSAKIQQPGVYESTVTLTATTL
jgi:hypothetical protein